MKSSKIQFLTLVFAIFLILACDKKDPTSPKPKTVTGKWHVEYTLSGTLFESYYNLIQSGEKLTGDFEFSDGSGATTLLTSSYIRETSISIEHYMAQLKMQLKGDVDDSFKSMSGKLYANSTYITTWSGHKVESPLKRKVGDKNYKEEFLKIFKTFIESDNH